MDDLWMKGLVALLVFAMLFTSVYYYHQSIYSPQTTDEDRYIDINSDDRAIKTFESESFLPREYIRIVPNDK